MIRSLTGITSLSALALSLLPSWTTSDEPLVVEAHEKWARSVIYTPDGEEIITGGDKGFIKTWDGDGEELSSFLTFKGP